MLLGSYQHYGLVYWLHGAVRPVPLHGVAVDAHIVDFCVRTAITQQFSNTEARTPPPRVGLTARTGVPDRGDIRVPAGRARGRVRLRGGD